MTREEIEQKALASPFYQEELEVLKAIPDGVDYYNYVVQNVVLDRSNPKNSYYMYLLGMVDSIDLTKPCSFTKSATALPDIDTDFPTDYREVAIDYVRNKYGSDKVCQIVTFGRLSGRSALKAVLRTAELCDSYTQNLITEHIPDEAAISDQLEEMDTPSILLWCLEHVKEINDYAYLGENDEILGEYADAFKKALKLEGTFQTIGKHAAGVIISSEKISDISPMAPAKDGSSVAALDMQDLEKVGLVKFDFLGVDILNKISAVMGAEILSAPLDDEDTWELIQSGNTKGFFQLEGKLGMHWAKELGPENIEQLGALTAILRPGTLSSKDESGRSMTKVYCERKNGLEEIPDNNINKVIDTYGVLIYQETLLKICKELAGFNSASSIKMMKCISCDSLVYTRKGPKRIDAVSSGEEILSVNNGKSYFAKIKRVWSTGEQEVFRIRSANGFSIDVTQNHQILTSRGWLKLSEIDESHYIVIPKNYNYDRGYIHSKEKSIIIGYFITEGCYTELTPYPKITNKDQNVIDLLEKSIKSEFGDDSVGKTNFENGVMDIRLLSKARKFIVDNFQKNKSAEKFIPQRFITLPQNHLRTIISCMFDGDGTISKNNVQLTSASLILLRQVQSILLCDGIYSSISQKYDKNYEKYYYNLNILTKRDVSKFYNLYTEFICENKKNKILSIIEQDYNDEMSTNKFRIPEEIVQSCFGSEKLNSIIGHFINAGQCYNNSLTVDKARYLNKLVCSPFMQEVLDSDFYYVQVKDIISVGKIETFDYETEDSNHCGFINGILVHNSVGKKNAKLLFSLEQQFLDGCKKVNVINESEAKTLFDTIKKSSRYLFNKSHSISYSYLSYWSAYTKKTKPLEFYREWLNTSDHKLDPHAEVRNLVLSARADNYEIEPPSVKFLTPEFFIREGRVHFGLTHIKGVSSKELDKLFQLLTEYGVILSIPSLLFDVLQHINKRTCESLINCGAFGYLGISRAKLLHYYTCSNMFTAKEVEFFKKNKFDSFETAVLESARLKKEGGAASTAARLPKLQAIYEVLINPGRSLEDTPARIASIEDDLIGIPLSCGYMDSCLAAGTADATCQDFKNGRSGKMSLNIKVKEIKEHVLKDDSKMAFLTIEDDTGELDAVIFKKEYEMFGRFLYPGAFVGIFGEKSQKGSLVINRAVEL
jgi:DNA polymerase-3 subunit alpha